MMKPKTYYHLILDRSGSMSVCIEETVSGLNQQILRIKEIAGRYPDQELLTSLTIFNHEVTPTWDRIEAEKLRVLNYSDFKPDGLTALCDAVGVTITDMVNTIGQEINDNEATAVVVIVTDGYENASRSFTLEKVSSMIAELENSRKWSFSYIGATLDAVDIAVTLNIKRNNAIRYDTMKSETMFNTLSNSLSDYIHFKGTGEIKNDFLLSEEDEQ